MAKRSTKKKAVKTAAPVATFQLVPADAEHDMLEEFVTESREQLEGCEAALLMLEAQPEDEESVNTVFRGFHTIKGTASCLGLADIGAFAHRAESLLSRMRDREIRCEGRYAEMALRSVDTLRGLTEGVQAILGGGAGEIPVGIEDLARELGMSEAEARDAELESATSVRNEPPVAKAVEGPKVPKTDRPHVRDVGSESVRVRTDRLDRLVDMVGELVVAESMVASYGTELAATHPEMSKQIERTGKIVRELQDLSLTMRMIPMRGIFQKLTRTVRDLSHKCNKAIDFVTEGEETEIDRTMVELISDPLVHMVRNAVDHGVEPAEQRAITGKPANGRIRLSALHAGGSIVIVLEDDGRGLDRDRIVEKGIGNGLIESDSGMSDSEVFSLIFEAGFSTADQVTDVSGRGVGLDVVRRSIDQLQGRMEISSTPGEGARFTIRLPLTLAITDGMQIRVGSQRYILPTVNIAMSFRPKPEEIATVVGRGEILRRREACLPLYRLSRLFDVPDAVELATDGLAVVVDDGEGRYGLLVDDLVAQHQVVVKPLESGCGKIRGVSGAAILGDGSVGLILEPREIGILGGKAEARISASASRITNA